MMSNNLLVWNSDSGVISVQILLQGTDEKTGRRERRGGGISAKMECWALARRIKAVFTGGARSPVGMLHGEIGDKGMETSANNFFKVSIRRSRKMRK